MTKQEFKARYIRRFEQRARQWAEDAFDGGDYDYRTEDPEECADDEIDYSAEG